MPTVSIVIPCYNAGEWIEEAVDSILAQTYKNYEIIIVNDGSTDLLTKEKLRKYEHSSSQVIHQENKGLAGARNTGIRKAKGKYILALDADDMLMPTFLEKAVSVMENSPRVGVVACWRKMFGEMSDLVILPRTVKQWSILISNDIAASSLFRKVCWEEVGGYDESLKVFEDWEFWIRVFTLGWQRYAIQEALFRYRVRSDSLMRSSSSSTCYTASTYIYKKYQDLYKKHFWKIVRKRMSMYWKNPYLLKKENRIYSYAFIFACRDNMHPLIYRPLQVLVPVCFFAFKILRHTKIKIKATISLLLNTHKKY